MFLSFSYIQSPSQPYNAPPIHRPVSRFFCRWSLLTGFHFPHVQCIDIFVAFSLFNSWTVCFPGLLLPSENKVFHNLCTVFYWRLCSLTNSPIIKYPLNWGQCALSAEGSPKQWLPNGKLLLLSLTKCHGVPCSLPSRITTKVLKNCKTFSSRPRPNVQDQDFMIQDQDFHFCPRGASRPMTTSLLYTRTLCSQSDSGAKAKAARWMISRVVLRNPANKQTLMKT